MSVPTSDPPSLDAPPRPAAERPREAFRIERRDPASRARAGVIATAHGEIRTPGFVPLATKATVRGLLPAEVAALGYDIVLGNTFHLMLAPGHELIRRAGGLHRFMAWDGPIITDSGGFQVFSMGHGTVADEIKGRGASGAGGGSGSRSHGRIDRIEEEGVAFRSYVDGSKQFLSPERSMEVQAALGTDLAVVFDECTPFHVDREYTQRSTERTHRWLERCLTWHERHAPGWQLVYGIVQGGVYEDLRHEAADLVAASRADAIAIGGSLGSHKEQMYEVVDWTTSRLGGAAERKPRHLLGIGEIDDLVRGVEVGIDTFDCAMPTRIGRHGMALVPEPEQRWRVDLTQARWTDSDEPLCAGCPCPACAQGFTRGYLRYLTKHRELLGMRLLTQHNLAFVARLMARLRQAIIDGRLAEEAAAIRGGAMP
ncbi:tRNA guanosine(34) transglycosylase Tgt [Patulibacter brassicae]|uniref:Queuine tRNA-ribosyltransferase n=1 Tax=Patulibacter brassicae TaxID=1705717 RepID=A0ABU4VNP2_9ACTN|nr:tRNA guanosine(34) transglycosylase Tgt [Patulibacter brassicae]MDX8153471.1 tRNA guanosine(34) transglycosylase Tgt [Patulibacter brassicae]